MARAFKVLRLFCALAIAFAACPCARAEALDYSIAENWAYYEIGKDRAADVFFVCPTVDMGRNENYNMSMSDARTKESFVGAINMQRGIYDEVLTFYAPYYRQASFPVYSLTPEESEAYFALAYQDVREAFVYFAEHTDANRPFVLAGFSQGADMALRLLKEFFSDPAYQNRLVAAYLIGWRVTQDDLDACPWLKLAEKADDIGAIISFNSEAVEVTESLLVPAGVKTFAINPLNWTTGGEYARADQNLGACFTNYQGEIEKEIAGLTGAYLDAARGTLKVPDIDPQEYSNSLFPDGVYHLYDYQFFYRDLQANVATRLEAYEALHALDSAA